MKFHSAMNHLSHLFLVGIFLIFPITAYTRSTIVGQQQLADRTILCITTKEPNHSTFPEIGINFRLIDEDRKPITDPDLVGTNLKISEDNSPKPQKLTEITSKPGEGGFSYYIIVDKGNRSDQEYLKSVLLNFSENDSFNRGIDEVRIYTDENNTSNVYYPQLSGNTLAEAVSDFQTAKGNQPHQVMSILDTVLDEIENNPFSCEKMPLIIMIVGDGVLGDERDKPRVAGISERFKTDKTNFVKLLLIHIPHPTDIDAFKSEKDYNAFLEQVHGDYKAITSYEQVSGSSIFEGLKDFRQIYDAKYITNDGKNGTHKIRASYNDISIDIKGKSSYDLNLDAVQIKLSNDSIEITRNKTLEGGYDKESENVQVIVTWPKGYIGELNPKANLHVKSEDGSKEIIPVNLNKRTNSLYDFNWVFGSMATKDRNQFSITLEVFDKFETSIKTPENSVIINNISPIPPDNTLNTIMSWLIYVGIAIAGLITLFGILIVILFIRFRNFNFLERGKEEAIKIAKTFVGGAGSRKKPLFILHVIEGPHTMLQKDLPVYTESVKLGRDDKKADLIFYGMDTNSSVSSLHARVERVNGIWRIVAISESGSETFINDVAIPFNEPRELNSGDRIRLGYLARQSVELEFITDLANRKPPASGHHATVPVGTDSDKTNLNDPDKTNILQNNQSDEDSDKTVVDLDKTDIGDESVPDNGNIRVSDEEKKKIKSEPVENVDDIFEGFRNRK